MSISDTAAKPLFEILNPDSPLTFPNEVFFVFTAGQIVESRDEVQPTI